MLMMLIKMMKNNDYFENDDDDDAADDNVYDEYDNKVYINDCPHCFVLFTRNISKKANKLSKHS